MPFRIASTTSSVSSNLLSTSLLTNASALSNVGISQALFPSQNFHLLTLGRELPQSTSGLAGKQGRKVLGLNEIPIYSSSFSKCRSTGLVTIPVCNISIWPRCLITTSAQFPSGGSISTLSSVYLTRVTDWMKGESDDLVSDIFCIAEILFLVLLSSFG